MTSVSNDFVWILIGGACDAQDLRNLHYALIEITNDLSMNVSSITASCAAWSKPTDELKYACSPQRIRMLKALENGARYLQIDTITNRFGYVDKKGYTEFSAEQQDQIKKAILDLLCDVCLYGLGKKVLRGT